MKIIRYVSKQSLIDFKEDKIDIGELLKRSISKSIKNCGKKYLKPVIPIKIIIPDKEEIK